MPKSPNADDSAPPRTRHQHHHLGALKPDGLQRTVLLLALTKPARLYVNEAIIAEYASLLARPELKIRKGLRQQLLQLIKSRCHCVAPTKRLQVTPDPDDDIFLDWRR